MKVLMINGSCHEEGCTWTALNEVAKSLKEEGIDSEIIQLGNKEYKDCGACGGCRKVDKCVIDDIVNELIDKARLSDGFVFGSPTYYAHSSGRILSVLDRLFFAGSKALSHKPGTAVVSARRAGTTANLDVLNKYFTINNMPVVSSNYWNMVHGHTPDEVVQDLEGMQIMNVLGKNMAWLLKCIEIGKKNGIDVPKLEDKIATNFIR